MLRDSVKVEGNIKSNKGFFIGDICYALDRDLYHSVWGKQHNYEDGIFEVKDGYKVAVGSTYEGDGCYRATKGTARRFSVDAGVIGVTPMELFGDNYNLEELKGLGYVYNKPGEVEFHSHFGGFQIILPNGRQLEIDT